MRLWLCAMLAFVVTCGCRGGASTPLETDPVVAPRILAIHLPPQAVRLGTPFTFRAEVTGEVAHWAWDFGEHSMPPTSTDSEPTVVFSSGGDIAVTLQVSNSGGADEKTQTLQVYTFTAPPDILSVTPRDLVGGDHTLQTFQIETSQQAQTYTWDFGGGATPSLSTEQAPTVRLGDPGVYPATVQACNDLGCSETVAFDLVVEVATMRWQEFEMAEQGVAPALAIGADGNVYLMYFQSDGISQEYSYGSGRVHLARARADADPALDQWSDAASPLQFGGECRGTGLNSLELFAHDGVLWSVWRGQRSDLPELEYPSGLWRIDEASALSPGTWQEVLFDAPVVSPTGRPSLVCSGDQMLMTAFVPGPYPQGYALATVPISQALQWNAWTRTPLGTIHELHDFTLGADDTQFYLAGIRDGGEGQPAPRTIMVGRVPAAQACDLAQWTFVEVDRRATGCDWVTLGLRSKGIHVAYESYDGFSCQSDDCNFYGRHGHRSAAPTRDFGSPADWVVLPFDDRIENARLVEVYDRPLLAANGLEFWRELGPGPGPAPTVLTNLAPPDEPPYGLPAFRGTPAIASDGDNIWSAYLVFTQVESFTGHTVGFTVYSDSRLRIGRLTLK